MGGEDMNFWEIFPEEASEELKNFQEEEEGTPVPQKEELDLDYPVRDAKGEEVEEEEEEEQEKPEPVKAKGGDEGAEPPKNEPQDNEDYSVYGKMMNQLVSDNLVPFNEESEKEYEDSEQGFAEFMKDALESSQNSAVQQFYNELPDKVKDILDLVQSGGKVEDYFDLQQDIDYDNIDMEDVYTQRNLVEDLMSLQGYSAEEIARKIELYEEKDLLAEESELARQKLKVHKERVKEDFIKNQKEEKERIERETKEEIDAFKDEVLNTRSIKDFKVSSREAEKLWEYVSKPVDANGNTQFELDDTPEDRLFYAWFKMNNYNKEKLSKQERSNQIVKLKKELSKYTSSNASSRGRVSEREVEENSDFTLPDWFGVGS